MNAGERIAMEGAEIFVAKERLTIDGETGIAAPIPPKIDLATALDVRREMAKVYREVRAKRIDPADGTKLVYILAQVGKMIELHEIESRLTALEERNGKSLPSPR
jgi:hypothetical protein